MRNVLKANAFAKMVSNHKARFVLTLMSAERIRMFAVNELFALIRPAHIAANVLSMYFAFVCFVFCDLWKNQVILKTIERETA